VQQQHGGCASAKVQPLWFLDVTARGFSFSKAWLRHPRCSAAFRNARPLATLPIGFIDENAHSRQLWADFLQEFQTFPPNLDPRTHTDAGEIAARSRHARDNAELADPRLRLSGGTQSPESSPIAIDLVTRDVPVSDS
jgi:hypothetical protein